MIDTFTPNPPHRNFTDYFDRQSDGDADLTDAIRRALHDGPGVLCLPPGRYRWNDVCIPANTTLTGCGPQTVVTPYDPNRPIFDQAGVGQWSLRVLKLQGGNVGVRIRDSWAYRVSDVEVEGFTACGIHVEYTRSDAAASSDGGTFDHLRCNGNGTAIVFDERAEYVSLTHSSLFNNTLGCAIHAGNVRIAHCNVARNRDGVYIEDKQNGSHGVVSHCLLNHNERYALHVRNVRNGMIVDGCCFYYGTLLIEDADGVTISNGQLSCGLVIRGEGVNQLHGNYIVENGDPCELSPATLIEGNYTRRGSWAMNRPRCGSDESERMT